MQFRRTGEPYVSHCIETALIVERNCPRGMEYERWVWQRQSSTERAQAAQSQAHS